MIILPRKTPEQLTFYEVMMRRAQNPDEYFKLYAQVKSGYIGELRLDREWKDVDVNGLLFHDFTCFNIAGHSHQIDTIFVCKHFVLVIEAKNITGHIHFNANTRQLVRRKDNGNVEAFTSPVDQVKRHRLLLENHFLTLTEFIPVEAAVVITNPSCVIGQIDDDISIFIVNGLRSKLEKLVERYKHININTRLVRASLEKLYRPHKHQPWHKVGAIQTGVLCLNCNKKMISSNKGFKCTHCKSLDQNHLAVRRTLYDYRILFGPEISNQKFREFANIVSPDTAYGILSRLITERKGTKRALVYVIPENIYNIT